jgi:hypothetical protein
MRRKFCQIKKMLFFKIFSTKESHKNNSILSRRMQRGMTIRKNLKRILDKKSHFMLIPTIKGFFTGVRKRSFQMHFTESDTLHLKEGIFFPPAITSVKHAFRKHSSTLLHGKKNMGNTPLIQKE